MISLGGKPEVMEREQIYFLKSGDWFTLLGDQHKFTVIEKIPDPPNKRDTDEGTGNSSKKHKPELGIPILFCSTNVFY